MKPERIEDLLRQQPPDEPPYGGQLDLSPVTTDAVRPGPTRRAGPTIAALGPTALIVIALAVLIGTLIAVGSAVPTPSPSPSEAPQTSAAVGVIPWVETTPAPTPTPEPTPDPASLLACQPADLALVSRGWGGATGSMAGGITLVNVSANPCHVATRPSVELLDAGGSLIAAAAGSGSATDLVALPAGGDAGAFLVWSNWCLPAPQMPLRLGLTVAAGVAPLTAEVRSSDQGGSEVPRCDDTLAGSSVGLATRLATPLAIPGTSPSGGATPETCVAADLVAFSGGWGGAGGSSYTTLVVLNVGSLDCTLPDTPTLEVRDAHGQLDASTGAPEPTAVLTLPVESTAITMIGFSNWCGASPALPLGFDLVIGSTAVPVGSLGPIPVPPCMAQPATPPPNLFYNDPLTVPGAPAPPEPDPGDFLPVSVTVSPLPTVAPGAVLNYKVTLTNESAHDKPINLVAECPSYVERLFLPGSPTGIKTTLALNCEAAGWLAGGASETFEMRLPIPFDAPAGTATLVWQLGQRGPATKVTFQIGS